MPDLDALFLPSEKKEKLRKLIEKIAPEIEEHLHHKNVLVEEQKGRCFGCGKELNQYHILRRIDPKKERIWENACIVCKECNDEREDFLIEDQEKTGIGTD